MSYGKKSADTWEKDIAFAYDPELRLKLPSDDEMVFEEVQPFDQIWLWTLMSFEMILLLIVFFAVGVPILAMFALLAVMTLPLILLSSLKLKTRIDDVGIHYQMVPFHFKPRTIRWDEMENVYVRKYKPITEYGGWGIKHGKNGLAINVKGDYGIQIFRKNRKPILLGTQLPEMVIEELKRRLILV